MNEKGLTSIEKGNQGCEQNGTSVPDGNATATSESGGGNISTDVTLSDAILEKLYRSYSVKQRRAALIWFLVASILFDVWALAIPQGQSLGALGSTAAVLFLNVLLCILIRVSGDSRIWQILWEIAPFLVWLLAVVQLTAYLFMKSVVSPRDFLGWAVLMNFLVYVTLPVSLVYTLALLGLGAYSAYMCTIVGIAKKDLYFWEQISANIALIVTAAVIGVIHYHLGEAKLRRAFLEAKKSLEVKMVIEEQSAEQERLLLSVLPEHVAVKMRQDLGSTNSEQFKKIYMSRHENVSILYADIVGFTAISSTYSAQDLVKMLNELFARFDRLAEKYKQLRIKILGDCYYCISGAPVERPDHAVLCVHMGLSMVKAIKYVQQKTNSPVDMRVGIHTGAVLAGILGQRQWQFDVYSKDVELANKMESSGKAGRVHISEKTLSFLSGEFEVEPAYGEKREEALRIAGLKTYFITKVLKPFIPVGKKNGTTSSKSRQNAVEDVTDVDSVEIIPDEDSKANSGDEDGNAMADKEKEEDLKQRLKKELVARDGHGDLSKDTTIFLTFKNNELEAAYSAYREPFSSMPLTASIFVQIVDLIYTFMILPRTCFHFTIIIAPLILIAILVFVSLAENHPTTLPDFLVKFSKRFNDTLYLRRFAAILIILFLGFTNLTDMCYFAILNSSKTDNAANSTLPSFPLSLNITDPPIEALIYPSNFSHFCVLILIAIAVIAQLTHILKIFFMLQFAFLHCLLNVFLLDEAFELEDQQALNVGLPMRFNVSLILFVVAISLSFLARHMDKEDRVIFKWKTEVAEQKEKASDMRRRNEALVYNVLPVHVAEHFMKNKKRSHDDLYSQSYAEVGVLFASMPNFTDFYSEETVNNQGLECLRFLNEVISDYDALLELPQFQDIIKIKTIGSTYMAASGLNPSRQVKPDDPIIVRWAHLALLVEFALELKKALQGINEQSFNHFVLKMGINHGPITAGVIGARKPHYDIWGNTVNVASRMESTGKAGAIQVTEETCQILQTFGYTFEQRGLVSVKGKGQLMTYYLQGKSSRPSPPSPIISTINTMEPLPEVEEPTDSPKTKVTDENEAKESLQDPISKPNLTLTLEKLNNPGEITPDNDPRSPRATNPILNTLSDGLDTVEKLSTIKQNGIENTELDVDVDAKTPLLNLNSTNLESREFSASEKDSLIARD